MLVPVYRRCTTRLVLLAVRPRAPATPGACFRYMS